MATAHLSVKVGKSGKATPHAEYIAREGKYAQRLAQGEKLEATESGNMPEWAQADPMEFWKAADQYERKNGYVYREHEIALPRELNAEQRAELVREWVRQELGERHAYTWAIHNKTALDGGEQPHVHLMFSERTNDGIQRDPSQYFKRYNPKHPERGGARKHSEQGTHTERAEALKSLRGRWESLHNAYIDRYVSQETIVGRYRHKRAQISMKSLSEQGIDRQADRKLTPSESAAMQRKAAADREAQKAMREVWDNRPAPPQPTEQEKHEQAWKEQEQKWAQQEAERRRAEQQAEAERKAAEQEKARAEAKAWLAALPTAELVQKYQFFQRLSSQEGRQQIEQEVRKGEWFVKRFKELQDLNQQEGRLKSEQENLVKHYHNERQRRENSFFGLGAIGTMVKKENAKQTQMHAAYQDSRRRLNALYEYRAEKQSEYDERLKAESDKQQRRADRTADVLADEMMRRPLAEFKQPYLQAAQNITTPAGRQALERVQNDLYYRPKNGISERVIYFNGAASINAAEKAAPARQQPQRPQQKSRAKSQDLDIER